MTRYALTITCLIALCGCHTGTGLGGHRQVDTGTAVRATSTQYPQVGDHTILAHPALSEAVSHQSPDPLGPGSGIAGTHRGASLTPRAENSAERAISQSVTDALVAAGIPGRALNDIHVRTLDGDVILRGQVLTQAEKEFIEETAKRLPGVRSVHNHLRVTTRR
jgi:hypothetical protein